jgi:predicted PurR-regulated permease PerM
MRSTKVSRVVEYVFFFGLLAIAGYMVWQIMEPFLSALALAAIIVTICSPLHEKVLVFFGSEKKTIAAFLTTVIVFAVIVLPLITLSSLLVREVADLYTDFSGAGTSDFEVLIMSIETKIQQQFPAFQGTLEDGVGTAVGWSASHLSTIFTATLSTILTFILSILGSFYFFRDGKELMQLLIKASPLPEQEDKIIFDRIATAVRAVATGTLLLAIIQGTLVAVGFLLFGIDRAVLWGSIASLGALMPGIGTTIVTVPAIIYLFFTEQAALAIGLLVWSVLIVGLVDNILGPYLIGRRNNMHPFVILISVLGGIALFGPLGFIIGPVVTTLFFVLLEIYNQYIIKEEPIKHS